MMRRQNYFTKEFVPPSGLVSAADDLQIFPTALSAFREDYEAVMASRAMLRIWGGDSWPEDDFTPEQNHEDLKFHVQDNEDHAAYGYMIFNGDRSECLGSVYVNPAAPLKETHKILQGVPPWDGHWAYVAFWTRSDRPGLEEKVYAVLRNWLEREWPAGWLLMSRPLLTERNGLFAGKGLELVSEVRSSGGAPMLLFR